MTSTPAPRNGQTPKGRGTTAIFVGHGRLPQSIGSVGSSAVVSIEVEVDLATSRVERLGASGVLPLAAALLQDLLQGGDFDGRIDDVLRSFQGRYVGPCQRAICSALLNAYEAYLRHTQAEAPVVGVSRP